MEANKGKFTGKGQVIGPDGKVKFEFTLNSEAETPETNEAVQPKQEEVEHERNA